jgi:hypothetical protein
VRWALAALVLYSALGTRLSAQIRGSDRRIAIAEDGLQVYLVTFGEGELYFEKFGHNALWFRHGGRGIDEAYNWGEFDFAAPGFLRRLLIGDSRYWVSAYRGGDLIEAFRRLDRTVILQRLNLTAEQADSALAYARWNARNENKFYRYDYFRDNCSTRVRDLIDRATGGALKRGMTETVDRTYRSETLRLVDDLKFTQLGIDVALGRPTDRKLSVWESAFVPMRLREAIRDIQVTDSTGLSRPLVAEERTVYSSQSHAERPDAPRLWVGYLVLGLFLGAELFGVAWASRRSPTIEKVFRLEVALWAFATGLLGLVVLLAWLITEHIFWFRNENLLLFNPLSLFLMVLAIMSMKNERWLRPAAICAVIIAMLGAIALALKGVPGSQDNLPLILLLLPAHFAIAHALWSRVRDGASPVIAP